MLVFRSIMSLALEGLKSPNSPVFQAALHLIYTLFEEANKGTGVVGEYSSPHAPLTLCLIPLR